ncbi:DUF4251 domain-containing protein [Mesohalobacter halotolerans]|uniref:DUF4251 domain-containing protein n=1 Tax=Mesohalobacter halotolerans TaxID=1883405 RepID=A0A4U5TS35_9FLAO|nr:DUF4251 domain-containing protein [Mesohalobacter halotolerans]MBS3738109.1 DUF4251 domain-containing protein [Psychroflexus sp.]TKS57100.1 DUF4251 domain-containing protein [Mesohalobacter halotolerans]
MKKNITCKLQMLICIAIAVGLFYSCKAHKIDKSKTKIKNKAILDSLYALKSYYVDVNTAYPFNTSSYSQVANTLLRNNAGNTANRIDLSGDGNYLEIQNDSVKAYLPFFGEQRLSAGDYGGRDLSIKIDEPVDELLKQIDSKKDKLTLKFSTKQDGSDNDKYKIIIDIFPNENVSVKIMPVYRTFMRYDGHLNTENDKK